MEHCFLPIFLLIFLCWTQGLTVNGQTRCIFPVYKYNYVDNYWPISALTEQLFNCVEMTLMFCTNRTVWYHTTKQATVILNPFYIRFTTVGYFVCTTNKVHSYSNLRLLNKSSNLKIQMQLNTALLFTLRFFLSIPHLASLLQNSHGSVHVLTEWNSYLIMLSGLDGLQQTDPVLHLFSVLCTEDEPTKWSDHLDKEECEHGWVRRWRGWERERSAFPAKGWRGFVSIFRREKRWEPPISLSPVYLSKNTSSLFIFSPLSLALRHIYAERQSTWAKVMNLPSAFESQFTGQWTITGTQT